MEKKDFIIEIKRRIRHIGLSCRMDADVLFVKNKRFCLRINRGSLFPDASELKDFETLSHSYLYGWKIDDEGNSYYYFKFYNYETKQ